MYSKSNWLLPSISAQFYISCAQVAVTGGGSGSPSPLVSFPGAYTGYEPGLLINIYNLPSNFVSYPSLSLLSSRLHTHTFHRLVTSPLALRSGPDEQRVVLMTSCQGRAC
jgi:hypothetical protein